MLVQQVGSHHFDAVEQVLDPLVTVMAGPADNTDYLVPLGKEQLGEVGAILAGHAGNERFRHYSPALAVVSSAAIG
jgi:hypothetical protein